MEHFLICKSVLEKKTTICSNGDENLLGKTKGEKTT